MSGTFAAAPLCGMLADKLKLFPVIITNGFMAISLAPILLLLPVGEKEDPNRSPVRINW